MLRRSLCVAPVVAVVVLSAVPAFGQGRAASIIGQVTDQSGAVLPGVTVTATSPALQVPEVTAVTNEVGEYRLAPCRSASMRPPSPYRDFRRSGGRTSA